MNRTVSLSNRWMVLIVAMASILAACGGSSGTGGGGSTADTTGGANDTTSDDVAGADASDDASGDTASSGDTSTADSDAAGPVCKSPAEGVCVGTTLTYCEEGVGDQSYDCDDGEGASCVKISDDFGYDCALPTEATCIYINDDGDLDWLFCAGAGAACVVSTKNLEAGCVTGQPACTEDEIGDCKGDHVLLDCYGSQPFSIDCKDFGGTCAAGNEHATCTGIAKGGVCDDVFLFCAGGATCDIAEDADFGVCP